MSPRRWQHDALHEWARERRGVASVVTGGGKTVFAYMCMQRFFSEFADGRVVIVVPTIALLDQWFLDIPTGMDIPSSAISCFSGTHSDAISNRVCIVVLNTARNTALALAHPGPTMLIVDECHRAGSPHNALALQGDHVATLGLSATPERENDDGFEQYIVPALGPVIYEYGYDDARADGVIVDFDIVNIDIQIVGDAYANFPALKAEHRRLIDNIHPTDNADESRRLEGVVTAQINRAATSAIRIPWAARLALQHRAERVIIFHERLTALGHISSLIQKHHQNVVTYHSGLDASVRRDNLHLFRRGMVNMLVTCRALDEGANIPEANVAVIARSTSSIRQRIQRLGRVLRPANGKEHATVYTLYQGEDEAVRLTEESIDLEGVAKISWKRGQLRP